MKYQKPLNASGNIAAFRALVGSLCMMLVLCSGCADYLARKRMEGVAKGWCETIRASQVVPVYPLTQDLLVGDVFLVQTPSLRSRRITRERAFCRSMTRKCACPLQITPRCILMVT